MSQWKVMVSAPYLQPLLDRYRPLFDQHGIELVVPPVRERLSEEELLSLVPDLDGAICGDDRFSERVLAQAPKLKVISKWGTGIDSIDREAAARRGIAVRNTPNAFTEPVADTVLGLMLSFARDIPWTNQAMRAGDWEKRPAYTLREKTLGVIGLGNVGQAVVRRTKAFGMRVLGTDIREIPQAVIESLAVEITGLEPLLRQADFVSLNCDLNPTSRHLLNAKTIALLKPNAIVINTARGPLIDEAALVEALRSQRIAGAALDVFEEEPLPADSPLRSLPNVLLSPHNANAGPVAWERVHENTIKNLLDELAKHAGQG